MDAESRIGHLLSLTSIPRRHGGSTLGAKSWECTLQRVDGPKPLAFVMFAESGQKSVVDITKVIAADKYCAVFTASCNTLFYERLRTACLYRRRAMASMKESAVLEICYNKKGSCISMLRLSSNIFLMPSPSLINTLTSRPFFMTTPIRHSDFSNELDDMSC